MQLRPMLAEPVDQRQLVHLDELGEPIYEGPWYADDGHCFEQKVDGHRRLVIIEDGKVSALNRKGEPTTLPVPIVTALTHLAAGLGGRWALDGELVANKTLIVFDLPLGGPLVALGAPYDLLVDTDNENGPKHTRRRVLETLFETVGLGPSVKLLPCARTAEEKLALVKQLYDANCEGVMVKDRSRPYVNGKRSFWIRKAKFWHDIDCVVTKLRIGGKDNFAVHVYENGKKVPIGEVGALTGDGPNVKVDDVVCVKYLYSLASERRLVQPTMPRIRDDKSAHECTIDQLHFTNKEVFT